MNYNNSNYKTKQNVFFFKKKKKKKNLINITLNIKLYIIEY